MRPKGLEKVNAVVDSSVAKYSGAAAADVGYTAILTQLRRSKDPPMLWRLLLSLAMSSSLSSISGNAKKHEQLIHLIFKLDSFKTASTTSTSTSTTTTTSTTTVSSSTTPPAPPPELDSEADLYSNYKIADAHLYLCVNLLSSNTTFLVPFLTMIVRFLKEDACDEKRLDKIHGALSHALALVPKGRSELFPILATNFPFKRANTSKQVHYVKQLMRILGYCGTLRREVWGLIISKCIEVDVEIKIHSTGDVRVVEEEKDMGDEIFEIDEVTGESTEGAVKASNAMGLKRPRTDSIEADEYADKLDEMLNLLLQEIRGRPDKGEAYEILEDIFEGCVLRTHKSKFTQFVWFAVCKMDADANQFSLSQQPDPVIENAGQDEDGDRVYR
jgi:hypothetical protein